MTRTLLDTFDGRLHDAGLRLEVIDADGLQLRLSGNDTAEAQLPISAAPRFGADLPIGPMRQRISEIIDVRALLPVVTLASHCAVATCKDPGGKVVAAARLHEHVQADDRGAPITQGQLPWALEIDELTGYAKHARRAQDALDQLDLERSEGDSLTACARAAGIDLGGFAASPTVPLESTMPTIEGFRTVLDNLAQTILANWQGTVDQIDPEYLHDLRVAIRRTRAVLAQGKKALPPDVHERADHGFSWLGALTGPARDLDVYLIEWDGYVQRLDAVTMVALEPVHGLLERRRDAAVVALLRGLRSDEAQQLMSWWRAWLAQPGDDGGEHAARPLGRAVAKRIRRVHRDLIDEGRRIGPETPAEQVHDLRKQAKKLRYLFDCFGSLIPKRPRKRFVARLKTLQDILGEHQDAEVHATELRSVAHELSQRGVTPDTMVAVGKLEERLDQQRVATRARFDERFAEYDTEETERALGAALADL